MKKLPLYTKILIGLVCGVIYAFISSSLGWNEFTLQWIEPFGVIFIKLLKLIAVPLVLFSIITGIASITDTSKIGKMGLRTIGLYLFTTSFAVTLGILLSNIIEPGSFIRKESLIANRLAYEKWAQASNISIKDGKSFLTDSAYIVLSENVVTEQDIPDRFSSKINQVQENSSDSKPLQFLVDLVPENIAGALSNNQLMLQIIFFAILFGLSTTLIPKNKSKPVIDFFSSINDVFIKMVEIIMGSAPFFVFALLAGIIAKMANTPKEVFEIFKGLGVYVITVIAGLSVMIFIIYPTVLYFGVGKFRYVDFFRKILPAQLMAFSTSSSAATLPVTMKCVKENIGVSNNVASFVLPIGATVNMDGSSLLQAVACVFLAQLHFIDLSFSQQLTIILTATLASIGTAAIPSAALVMLIIVLQSVGLNPAWIAIIFPVDRILDMCRTVVNVTGDVTICSIVSKKEKESDLNI